jgi:oligosaccharide repeat unit polymerase
MSKWIEPVVYLLVLAIAAAFAVADLLPLTAFIWIGIIFVLSLMISAWNSFQRGRHPCFLFLGMLLLFQMGRLIASRLSDKIDPFQVVVQTAIPLDVPTSTAELTVFLIMLSALCVYLPCRWNFTPAHLHASFEQQILPAAYALLMLTFPFILFKDYRYLNYVRGHGGYLAIFTDSEGVLSSAGSGVRFISFLAYTLLPIVFVMERRRLQLALVTVLILISSVSELLIGLRGKVFLLLLTIWYLHKLKNGKGFSLVTLSAVAAVFSIVAISSAAFREERVTSNFDPIQFVAAQGISMGVTEVAIDHVENFRPFASSYFINEFKQGFISGAAFHDHQNFDNDLSLYLNADAFRFGFGTGSSYLAESFVFGGIVGVGLASLGVGFLLRWMHHVEGGFYGAVVLALILPSVIYMPRSSLLSPLSAGMKDLLGLIVIVPAIWFIRLCMDGARPPVTVPAPILLGGTDHGG